MNRIIVKGNKPINGKIKISGSKNAALPIIIAAAAINKKTILHNIPNISDILSLCNILRYIGYDIDYNGYTLIIDPPYSHSAIDLSDCCSVEEFRASTLLIGALINCCGSIKIKMPGGCAIGLRPIDMHIMALRTMGSIISCNDNVLHCSIRHQTKGSRIVFPRISVGATENAIIAASVSDGVTEIENAAMEPEIEDLLNFLISTGVKISGVGTRSIVVNGTSSHDSIEYKITNDRIETISYALAAIATGGEVDLINSFMHDSMTDKIKEIGGRVVVCDNCVTVKSPSRRCIMPTNICTMPYPMFPSDAQPLFASILSVASGSSTIKETLYENRFMYVHELHKMGAQINIDKDVISINGVEKLFGSNVFATDLRSGMSLVLAALVAEGETFIDNVFHIDRGYENIDSKLTQCGAIIKRI
uniref:UDP-N-acetylglucosamine 1-carboxyvinyltransferase n=1 Tax=Biomphalaria glabrata TaxID=6526 RepID=A0A2C9JN80_BIOGL